MSLTSLVFLIAFLAGCTLAFVRHPIYGLMTYVTVLFLHPPDRWWGQGFLIHFRWSLLAAVVTALAIWTSKLQKPAAPFLSNRMILLLLAFVGYVGVQLLWAFDRDQQLFLLEYYLKFLVVIWCIHRCVESEKHLYMFLSAFVFGSFYVAWEANRLYEGGRFDSFGGSGFGDANTGALTLALATFIAGALLLVSRWRTRWILVGAIPFLVNGIVMTSSRSAFLAVAVGGVVFNLFTPPRFRMPVRVLSLAAIGAFLLLTNASYWDRMVTISYQGAEIQGVDTGSGRIEIMQAQLRMFKSHPLGCGHFCTDYLSASYLDAKRLTSKGARSSHNTFLSFLVDQGYVGGAFYILMALWLLISLRQLARLLRGRDGMLAGLFPAIAACVGALFVADMFVPYVRYEPRFWLIALTIVMLRLVSLDRTTQAVGATGLPEVPPETSVRATGVLDGGVVSARKEVQSTGHGSPTS